MSRRAAGCENTGRWRASLQRCVRKLPADFREAIVLREMEELSCQEIATGVARAIVMFRLFRG